MNQKLFSGLLGLGVGAFLFTRDFTYYGHGGAVADAVPWVFIGIGMIYLLLGIRERTG